MSRFIDTGIYKINSSLTKEEANTNFETSCSMCYRAGTCNEQLCPIAKAFQNRIIVLESYQSKKTVHVEFVTTRKYQISSQNQQKKTISILLSKLSKLSSQNGLREATLILDDASVALELNDIDRMLDIISKYPKIYKKIKEILEERK